MKQINCVMLIDDHHPTNVLHTISIEEIGRVNKVVAFTNPIEALTYLNTPYTDEHLKPNIIFLDINMPVMSGWEFLEIYKQLSDDCKSEIMIIMLTTSSHPSDLQKAQEDSLVKDYIIKPLSAEVLEEILEKYF